MATPRKKPVKATPKPVQPEPSEFIAPSVSPLVFISHDTRDAELAEAFSVLLSDVSGGVLKSFRSSDRRGTTGIEFGAEWYASVMSKLDQATDVVALLTARSLERPWILYEAGVAKGKLDTKVLGLVVGVPLGQASNGPFGQFQNCADDEDSLTKLVMQLMGRVRDASPREEAVRREVQAFLATISVIAGEAEAPITEVPVKADENAVAKMVEEIKVLVRDVPYHVSNALSEFRTEAPRKTFRGKELTSRTLHKAMTSEDELRAAGWALFVSPYRESLPWVYELGFELSAAITGGSPNRIERTQRKFLQAIDLFWASGGFAEGFTNSEAEDFEALFNVIVDRLKPAKST